MKEDELQTGYFSAISAFDFWVKISSNFIINLRIAYSRKCKINNFSKYFS
jgi:hypothetical protein